MSSTIVFNSNNITDKNTNAYFRYDFKSPINLTDREIALVSVNAYYSWRNITETNNKLSYTWTNGTTYDIEIPVGFYEVSDLLAYCQFVWRQNGHYLATTDKNVYYLDFVVNPTNYTIDIITYPVPSSLPDGYTDPTGNFPFATGNQHPIFSFNPASKLNEILGFESGFSTPASTSSTSNVYSSTLVPNVNPNSSVTVVMDEVYNEFNGGVGELYTIVPDGQIGSLFVDRPNAPVYLPFKHGTFNGLSMRLINAQTGMPITIIDPQLHFMFSIRKIKNK
jgi:hypothetical protein